MAEYKINYTQSNFTGGIIAAELYGRNDFNKVKSGLKKCTNWTIREAGGLEFRRGTRFEALLPSGITNFKMASISETLLLFCEDGIRYLNDGSWVLLSYVDGCIPNLDNLHFTELQRKLYFYDSVIPLCHISLSEYGVPSVSKTIFEKSITGVVLESKVLGALPDVSVLVDHTYTVSLAKDAQHESIVSEQIVTEHTNAELGEAQESGENKAVQVNIKISLSDQQREDYADGKIYIYKKYQGYFYFLSAIDVKNPSPSYIVLRTNSSKYVRSETNDLDYFYGWRGNNTTYYTEARTPTVGDNVYVYSSLGSDQKPVYTITGTVESVSAVGGVTHISVSSVDCAQDSGYDKKCIFAWEDSDSKLYYTLSNDAGVGDTIYKYTGATTTTEGTVASFINNENIYCLFTTTNDTEYTRDTESDLDYLYAWRGTNDTTYYTESSEPNIGDTVYIANDSTGEMDVYNTVELYDHVDDQYYIVTNGIDCTKNSDYDRSAVYAWKNNSSIVYTKGENPIVGEQTYNKISVSSYTVYSFLDDYYLFEDKGQVSVDMSKTPKENPFYLLEDGSVEGVNSIADYGQRLFLTQSNQDVTRIIYSAVGNTNCLASSVQRDESEAGNLELPISRYDSWCKVVSGLDLILSTSYTINKVSGVGTLTTDTILWDGLSKTVEPVKTRRSLICTNGSNRNIYDLTYNEYGQYDSIDLTLLVKYIFETKTIKRLAFKDYPVKTIYVLCDDGDLYCLTYIKDQNIYGWYKIEHPGTIVDILVINTDIEDDVCLVVRYDTQYVLERAYKKTDNIYLDCAITKTLSSISNNTISGLGIFEGKKVRVFDLGNNLYYGDYDILNPQTTTEGGKVVEIDDLEFDGYLVTSGQITLPDSIVLTGDVIVGLPYYAVMETIPLEFSDANGNSTIGRKKTINDAYLRYGDSRGLTYKTMGHEYDCEICSRDIADNAQFLERGQVKLHTVSEYKWDSTIKILQRQPYPARIESITLGLTFNDKS